MRNEFNSEFMTFINDFLKAHPEVVKDQKYGWDIYWNPRKGPEDNTVAGHGPDRAIGDERMKH